MLEITPFLCVKSRYAWCFTIPAKINKVSMACLYSDRINTLKKNLKVRNVYSPLAKSVKPSALSRTFSWTFSWQSSKKRDGVDKKSVLKNVAIVLWKMLLNYTKEGFALSCFKSVLQPYRNKINCAKNIFIFWKQQSNILRS